ncbi:MAG: acyl carrier protein [Lachnospiraceae bacterium]|nr:acyl carrier protein [Lachnospiraceae bacterium]MBP3753857.1 acyl carrier protein [Lachnospiraceae bacterium]
MDKLKAILEELRPDVDFEKEENLVDGNVLDSFDIITLVAKISEEMGIEIDVDELLPENFNSLKAMEKLLEKHIG